MCPVAVVVAVGHCASLSATASAFTCTSFSTKPKPVQVPVLPVVASQSKQWQRHELFRLLATPPGNGDDGSNEVGGQEPLQSSLADLFSIGSRINQNTNDLHDDDEQQRVMDSRGLADSLVGDDSMSSGVPLALKTEFPSEGPLYEIGTGISVEERLGQELGNNDDVDVDGDGVAPFLSEDEYESVAPAWDGSIQPSKSNVVDVRREGGEESYRRVTQLLLQSDRTPSTDDLAQTEYSSPPRSFTTEIGADESETFLRVLNSCRNNSRNEADAEELHRRVFQSEAPLPFPLSSDGQIINGTKEDPIRNVTGRGAAFQRHREEKLASLERDMEKMLASFPEEGGASDIRASNESNSTREEAGIGSGPPSCSCCGCRLSPIELEHAREVAGMTKPLCRVCDAERFIERRPYWRPSDPRPALFAKEKRPVRHQQQVETKDRGPAQTYVEGHSNRAASSSTGDRQKWRAKFSSQSGLNSKRIVGSTQQDNKRSVSAPRRTEKMDKTDISTKKRHVKVPEKSTPGPEGSSTSKEVEYLRQQVNSLQATAEQYELQLSKAETEMEKLRNLVRDLENSLMGEESVKNADGSSSIETVRGDWVQVEDPDTGEIFYWNEETEEIKRNERL
mmetsp:Transcript_13106/g.28437  ORF Transcript_13106/g.28437 Transcript_13106/m.28437 type:complete len:621 (+) Transcript_13106:186-2048(+)